MTNEQAIKRIEHSIIEDGSHSLQVISEMTRHFQNEIILINGQSELFALTIRKLKQPRAPYQSGARK